MTVVVDNSRAYLNKQTLTNLCLDCWVSLQPRKQSADLLLPRQVLRPPQQLHQLWHLLLRQ